jgi:voltage-gated potassium channel
VVGLRLFSIGGAAAADGRSIIRRDAARFALTLAALTWVTSAAAFTLVEDVGKDGRLHSFGDALWWSIATITTVGYGDVSPVTFPGRVIGAFTMVVGISTFAVVTAKVAEFLVRSDIEGAAAPPPQPTAQQILKERLASGEIQIAEFTQLAKVLERHPETDG